MLGPQWGDMFSTSMRHPTVVPFDNHCLVDRKQHEPTVHLTERLSVLSLTTHDPHQNAPQNERQIQIIGQCHTSCWFRIILYPYILAYPMIFTQHVWLYILSGNHAWPGNWTSSINGGFMRGNIYKWWIFQQTMFDYQRLPPNGSCHPSMSHLPSLAREAIAAMSASLARKACRQALHWASPGFDYPLVN